MYSNNITNILITSLFNRNIKFENQNMNLYTHETYSKEVLPHNIVETNYGI